MNSQASTSAASSSTSYTPATSVDMASSSSAGGGGGPSFGTAGKLLGPNGIINGISNGSTGHGHVEEEYGVNGDEGHSAISEANLPNHPSPQHSAAICDSLWKVGFQSGAYSDVEILVRARSYKLHRLILSRSEYLAHLMNTTQIGHPVWVRVDDENVTDEAIAIALGHLYASYSYSMINSDNARDVLAAASFFRIPDLAAYAYDICKRSINVDTIVSWVSWCESSSRSSTINGMGGDGVGGVGVGNGGDFFNGLGGVSGGQDGRGSVIGLDGRYSPVQSVMGQRAENEWTVRLRSDVHNYLTHDLARQLSETSSSSPYNLTEDPRFLQTFVHLPFDLFKSLIENPSLSLGNDQERFAFAKKAIQARKKKAAALLAAHSEVNTVNGQQQQSQQPLTVENVVLQFGGGTGSNVHVTKKTRARALWKVGNQ